MSGLIHRNTVVTLDYSVTDSDGQVVDDGRNPIRYLHGGYGDIFDRIEETLEGKHVGDSVTIKLQPDEAYGDYDPELVQIEPASRFPKETKVGMQFEGAPEGSDEDDIVIYRVTDVADGKVVLDGNHPLAGMSLVFTCTVRDVRPATAEEVEEESVADEEDDSSAAPVVIH